MQIVQQIAAVITALIADAANRQKLIQMFSNAADHPDIRGLVPAPQGGVSIGFAGGPRVCLIIGHKWSSATEKALKFHIAELYGEGKLGMSNMSTAIPSDVHRTIESFQKAVAAGTAAKAGSGRKNDPAVVEDIKARLLAARDQKAAGQTVTGEKPTTAAGKAK